MSLELPDLTQALLDRETLTTLFADLEACTQVLEVRTKGGANSRTDPGAVDLNQARDQLLAGTVQAVQVSYRFEEATWRDTLMRRPGGVQLVRMQVDL